MAYSPPSLKVYQEFVPQLAGNTLPLFACIIAPQYGLHRFTEEDEKASLGAYSQASGNTYNAWPDKTAGSTVDVASSQIWVEDGILECCPLFCRAMHCTYYLKLDCKPPVMPSHPPL